MDALFTARFQLFINIFLFRLSIVGVNILFFCDSELICSVLSQNPDPIQASIAAPNAVLSIFDGLEIEIFNISD